MLCRQLRYTHMVHALIGVNRLKIPTLCGCMTVAYSSTHHTAYNNNQEIMTSSGGDWGGGWSLTAWALLTFITLRLLQRCYYLWKGHGHFRPSFSPRAALEDFLSTHHIPNTFHEVTSSLDQILLRYRRLGHGKKVLWLANGVGTDLFMSVPPFA